MIILDEKRAIMNILYLCTGYHRAMIYRDSMNMLESLGHNTLAFNAVAKGTKIDDKYIPIMDEKVVHEECFNRYDRYIFFPKQYKIYKRLLKKIDIYQYDVIHSHMLMNGGFVANRIKRKKSIPYVVTVRNTDMNIYLKIPVLVPLARKIANDANAIMFLSKTYKEQFLNGVFGNSEDAKKIIENKIYIIPNGLEDFWLKNVGEAKTLNGKVVRLICVGKIDYNKNMRSILKAITLLKRNGVKTNLTIVGQVVDSDVFEILRAQDDVELIPFQTKEKLINYYRRSDIFVMPSFTESFGRVYAEAMTQGVPVTYTRGQGFDGFFEEGEVGYSVDSHNSATIADAIIRIIDNYNEISRNCINNCRRFDWAIIAKDLEKMYSEVMTNK